jgi:hypothetical protein
MLHNVASDEALSVVRAFAFGATPVFSTLVLTILFLITGRPY